MSLLLSLRSERDRLDNNSSRRVKQSSDFWHRDNDGKNKWWSEEASAWREDNTRGRRCAQRSHVHWCMENTKLPLILTMRWNKMDDRDQQWGNVWMIPHWHLLDHMTTHFTLSDTIMARNHWLRFDESLSLNSIFDHLDFLFTCTATDGASNQIKSKWNKERIMSILNYEYHKCFKASRRWENCRLNRLMEDSKEHTSTWWFGEWAAVNGHGWWTVDSFMHFRMEK